MPAAKSPDNSANSTNTVNTVNAPQNQNACDKLVSRQLPLTDHNKNTACEAHESAVIILPTYATSDTRVNAEAEAQVDNQSNAQKAIESCAKQCVVEPAPVLEAVATCIEEALLEEEQPSPCASGKEVRAYCLEEHSYKLVAFIMQYNITLTYMHNL
uniref:Uncharacterized protein n=1 Tax=Bactrocera latifrons TaxID=174628 RepID=A0A0K8UBV2_BACLA